MKRKRRDPEYLRGSDFWDTPAEAMKPEFLSQLPTTPTAFGEPCFGAGSLARLVMQHRPNYIPAHFSDLYVRDNLRLSGVVELDARTLRWTELQSEVDLFITNPPWRRAHLFPILSNLARVRPTWALLPSDFMHRKNSIPMMQRCKKVVPIGPINFNPEAGGKAYQCYAWYLFGAREAETKLIRRWV